VPVRHHPPAKLLRTFSVKHPSDGVVSALERGVSMNCLNCGIEMTNTQLVTTNGHIGYEMCGRCSSLWLEAGEFDKMSFQQGSMEVCEHGHDEARNCPRCSTVELDHMKMTNSDNTLLQCRNCGGFWLDALHHA